MRKFDRPTVVVEKRRLGASGVRSGQGAVSRPRQPRTQAWGDPVLDALVRMFPRAISPRGERPRPLIHGVDVEVVAKHGSTLSEALDMPIDGDPAQLQAMVRQALQHYTLQPWYQIAITKANHRINLDGVPVRPITPEEKAAAQHRLRTRRCISA